MPFIAISIPAGVVKADSPLAASGIKEAASLHPAAPLNALQPNQGTAG